MVSSANAAAGRHQEPVPRGPGGTDQCPRSHRGRGSLPQAVSFAIHTPTGVYAKLGVVVCDVDSLSSSGAVVFCFHHFLSALTAFLPGRISSPWPHRRVPSP